MRSIPLWRYEVRRVGWGVLLAPPLVAALVVAVTLLDGSDGAGTGAATRNLFATLELALPLVAGVGAASLVGRDPAVELQLTMPTRYRGTLLRRLALLLGATALVAVLIVGLLLATGDWARFPPARGAVVGQLVWLAPTLWLAAVGFLAGAVLTGPAAAGGLVAVLWALQQIFVGVIQEHRWSRLLYLFATTRGTAPTDWMENRLVLLATAIGFGLAGWLLLGRAERLVARETE